MGTLQLRPPQFSEDLAWLPCWLQQNQTIPSNELEKESHCVPATKEFGCGVIDKFEHESLLPKEGGCNSWHLFLSGQDSIPESLAVSSENVLHFHLHLSSYGTSECSPTQHLDGSLHLHESNKVQSIHTSEAALDPRENITTRRGINTGGIDFLPQPSNKDIVYNGVYQSIANTEDHASELGEKSNDRYLKNAEFDNAIELSVMASEALVIHDLVKTELDSEASPMEAVLEVSLQVKKARVDLLENVFQSLNEEADLSDSLSALDDFMMKEAFDDVGLFCSRLNNNQRIRETTGFEVQDAPVTENLSTHDFQCNSVDTRNHKDKLEDESILKQLEENFAMTRPECLSLEPVNYNIQSKLSDDIVSASITSNVLRNDESLLQQSTQKIIDKLGLKQVQKIAFSTENTSMYLLHVNSNTSLHDYKMVTANLEERVAILTPDRFKSRWLGGWTGKEVDVTKQLRQNDGKTIPTLFVGETSFLSESADIAPDENSCVQRCETECQVASQSSIPFGYLNEKDNRILPISEDVVKCSLSFVDPLCSFVPCSISLDNDCSRQNLNETNDFAKECFGKVPEIEVENKEKMSDCKIISQHERRGALPADTVVSFVDGVSRPPIRRQSTSLKTYSVIVPTHVASSEGRKLDNSNSHQSQCNMRPLSLDPRVDCTSSSCRRNFVEPLPSLSTFKARPMDTVEDHQTEGVQNLVSDMTEWKTKSDEVADDGNKFLVQSVKQRTTPGILKQSLPASKPIINKCSIHHLENLGHGAVSDPDKTKSRMKMPYGSKNPLEPHMLVQKRVHFLEANGQLQESRDHQKGQPPTKNCPALRSSKRRKYSNQCLVSWDPDGNCYPMRRYCRAGKRLILQGIEFLLTGFSSRKEKDIEGLVWNSGGVILPDIPCPSSRGKSMSKLSFKAPLVILSSKKLQTTKFLYGCAVNAFILNVNWLTDSIAAGSILPPWKYMIISNQASGTRIGWPIRHSSRKYIFEKVGIMLQGKQGFCTKLAKILKHGGGQVFKTLQWLVKNLNKEKISVGVIVVEDEYKASRHLKQCALEQQIPMMSAKWIIKSLHLGELLPLSENNQSTSLPTAKISNVPVSDVNVEL